MFKNVGGQVREYLFPHWLLPHPIIGVQTSSRPNRGRPGNLMSIQSEAGPGLRHIGVNVQGSYHRRGARWLIFVIMTHRKCGAPIADGP